MTAPRHPVTAALRDICDALVALGFREVRSPQVEDLAHNFELLGIPRGHPERDPAGAFYLAPAPGRRGRLLRTHISGMHPRLLRAARGPARLFCAGRVFRSESRDERHSPVFHQVEALAVGRGLGLAQLGATLRALLARALRPRLPVRLRASSFPYTAPSVEADARCACAGRRAGCPLCGGGGWCELAGAGVLRPELLRRAGCPAGLQAIAFAIGVERCAMLREELADIRALYAQA